MDPIKTYFLKKLSSNPGFFAEVGKDSVMVDIKKETGLTVQDEQTLDLLYDEYGVDLTQKKRVLRMGNQNRKSFYRSQILKIEKFLKELMSLTMVI